MAFMNEMSKIKDRILPYLQGTIVDIGCGDAKITEGAIGVDGRRLPGVDMVTDMLSQLANIIKPGTADVVFSSHCLEHQPDDYACLLNWWLILRDGGYLILYLPDGRMYNNEENKEHFYNYNYKDFMFFFKRALCGEARDFNGKPVKQWYHLIESGEDFGDDRYSFFLVAQKVTGFKNE